MVRNEIFFQITQFDVKKPSLKSVFFLCIQKESYNFTTHIFTHDYIHTSDGVVNLQNVTFMENFEPNSNF